MAEKKKFQAIKGTRDLLPPDTELWNRVEATAREVFGTFGFGEIRPPIFEPTELFARSIGADTDVVGKEMYTFEDHEFGDLEEQKLAFLRRRPPAINDQGAIQVHERLASVFWTLFSEAMSSEKLPRTPENLRVMSDFPVAYGNLTEILNRYRQGVLSQDEAQRFDLRTSQLRELVSTATFGDVLSLRPEATASVCRAYIEHGMHAWPQPVKLYYLGPMFRRERPQKGRYRQFYQIGAEVLETVQPGQGAAKDIPKDAAVDAEVIEMVMTFFARLGLDGVQLEINSIGHAAENCRRGYVQTLKAALEKVEGRLGEDSKRRIRTNSLRVLDSKLESEQAIIAGLPRISEHLCNDCSKQYAEVKRQLDLRGVKYAENWRLVRGLDYYMRTTFEITAKGLGSQNAVCGGGRYDGLVELLGGLPTKGIGFAIGEDRLILSLQESTKAHVFRGRDVYIAWMGEKAYAAAIRAAQTLRSAGLSVELPPVEQKFGKALGQADKLGAKYALILGEKEISEGLWTLKIMSEGSQISLDESEVLEILLRGKNVSS
jgi:histidyl-tRNA synthetase